MQHELDAPEIDIHIHFSHIEEMYVRKKIVIFPITKILHVRSTQHLRTALLQINTSFAPTYRSHGKSVFLAYFLKAK